jgi:insertion element IS1 protein InsB
VAWVLGGRDTATFKRLYKKVEHLKDCTFYTDNWDAFSAVLPPERHIIGKAHTIGIEQDNSNTRHYLGRFTRKSKIVSKKDEMVDMSIKLWLTLTTAETLAYFKNIALSIYR